MLLLITPVTRKLYLKFRIKYFPSRVPAFVFHIAQAKTRPYHLAGAFLYVTNYHFQHSFCFYIELLAIYPMYIMPYNVIGKKPSEMDFLIGLVLGED